MLLTQRLETGVPQVHLDIHTDDVDAEVTRLERLGATSWISPGTRDMRAVMRRAGSVRDDYEVDFEWRNDAGVRGQDGQGAELGLRAR